MSTKDRQKKSTDGGQELVQGLFGELPTSLPDKPEKVSAEAVAPKVHGRRVDVHRYRSGNGKWAIRIEGIGCPEETQRLGRHLRQKFATGGSLREDAIELKGDIRERVMEELRNKGFKPVSVGG